MSYSINLWLYFAVVLGIVALPGLDMAFVLGSALIGGRRAGLAAVAGIVAGGACHVLMAALGVAALLRVWPALYPALLLGGAAYMGWIGWALLRGADGFALAGTRGADLLPAAAFRRAMLTNLMNPKAYVFMLAVFPQFLHAEHGPVWMQSGVLGAITALTQLAVYGALALAAARASTWFGRSGGAAAWTARALGVLLLATAALGLWQAAQA
ncbi:threonine/homoserine/homoserine lactone efflux protein [Pseudoduganella flava]|uniref:LysE family transporter n=1 Tax=Pseudoduganella flava TaxID=871742 RepID=A0A562PRA7_9BURK|nr:LysE family translocator [Pseudoduganella flava]QGZ37869.1 LysE family transporter [Pseudoduganella flava]TWI46700.1 threonine/homoserine/homoserine lactone efflux protein [Pseudoduganella flava]